MSYLLLMVFLQSAPDAASPWWALVLGPFGALVLSLVGNWVQWQNGKRERENGRQDVVNLTTALVNNTIALERVNKRLDREKP